MKNLLIYIQPTLKAFSPEHETLTKIQIDNSLALGWNKEDIMLVTNFPYAYNGVTSTVVADYSVFDADRSTKIPAINELFARNLIGDDLYWFHDHDAFQLAPIDLTLPTDAGFTDHGAYSPTWNAGSFFFKPSAKTIFLDIWHYMHTRHTNEQDALTYMWRYDINNITSRYTLLSPTYNIGIYKIAENVKNSELPIKVVHFHPHKRRHLELFKPMLSPQLLTIFKKYDLC